MSIKKKLVSVVAVGALALGITASPTFAAMKHISSDKVSVTASKDGWGKKFKSNGGKLDITVPAHKVSKKTSTNPRLYVILYKIDSKGKKHSVNTWTEYGSMLSKSYTMHASNVPKNTTLQIQYDADYTSSFTSKIYD